ncbi:F-box only protein 2 isoform X1 [Carassius gibelio]|uniref:F-box only protein 2 isoform X1 n=1 Tax=Carassius gibelio TaxID=101364 RepID=UPI002278C63A|nr:F-box only protein 2 isoform X1 [Carassius gibelio]
MQEDSCALFCRVQITGSSLPPPNAFSTQRQTQSYSFHYISQIQQNAWKPLKKSEWRRLCIKRQVIDLLAEGYDPENLDIIQPAVNVEDWFSSRTDCGCIYMLTVTLLDEHLEVIEEFKPEEVTIDPNCDECSWKKVSHTFTDYGPGLRFIAFQHGGKDTKYWKGRYGVRVTGSSVTLDI